MVKDPRKIQSHGNFYQKYHHPLSLQKLLNKQSKLKLGWQVMTPTLFAVSFPTSDDLNLPGRREGWTGPMAQAVGVQLQYRTVSRSWMETSVSLLRLSCWRWLRTLSDHEHPLCPQQCDRRKFLPSYSSPAGKNQHVLFFLLWYIKPIIKKQADKSWL